MIRPYNKHVSPITITSILIYSIKVRQQYISNVLETSGFIVTLLTSQCNLDMNDVAKPVSEWVEFKAQTTQYRSFRKRSSKTTQPTSISKMRTQSYMPEHSGVSKNISVYLATILTSKYMTKVILFRNISIYRVAPKKVSHYQFFKKLY